MKLLSVLLLSITAAVALQSCDAKPTETIKTVHDTDTVYTDRFAQKAVVVYGSWTVTTSSDTARAYFFQDNDSVSAYLIWKRLAPWQLVGKVTATGINLRSSTRDTLFYGTFSDSANGLKTKMGGNYFSVSNPPSGTLPTWSAKRD